MTRFGFRHFLILGALVGGTVMGATACAGNDSHSSGNDSLGRVSQAIETGVDGGATLALINEIKINPGGIDQPYEYIELRGTPGGLLTGFYFVSMEGEAGAAAGTADMVVNLGTACGGPCAFGSNGLLVITAATGGHTIPTETTVVTDTQFNAGGAGIENGSNSWLLVYSPTTPIAEGTDYDDLDAGTGLMLPAGAEIVDAVGIKEATADQLYGGVGIEPATSIDALTRWPGDDTPLSVDAWYGGGLTGANSDVTYTTTVAGRTANFPSDGILTPGAINIGTKGVDAGLDGAVDAAADGPDTALPDVAVEPDTALPDAASEVAVDAVTPDDAADAADAADTSAADAADAADGADAADAPTDATTADTTTADAADSATTDTATADTAAPEDTAVTEDTAVAPDTRPSTTDTGAATDTGPDVAPPATTDDEGCGCRTPGSSNTSSGAAFAALALAGLVAARRRR